MPLKSALLRDFGGCCFAVTLLKVAFMVIRGDLDILMSTLHCCIATATAFTFKKYKKAPQAHVLGSRGMLSPLQGVNEGDSVPLTKQ